MGSPTASEMIARLTPPTAVVGSCIKCQDRGVVVRGDIFMYGLHQTTLWHYCACASGRAAAQEKADG